MNNQNTNGNGPSAGNNNTNHQPQQRLKLPLMKTIEDAEQLSRIEQDNFYNSAFLIQCWIGFATLTVNAQYAEKKEARTRSLQTGQSWRSFLEIIGDVFEVEPDRNADTNEAGPDGRAGLPQPSSDEDSNIQIENKKRPAHWPGPGIEQLDKAQLTRFMADIVRFTEFDDPMADIVRSAVQCLWTECDRKVPIDDQPATLMRLCEWMDSILHLQANLMWQLAPATFDPDPDKRELASLGLVQRHLAAASDVEKAHWHWHFGEAAERFADSPKMSALATGLSSDATRVWNYPEVDMAVITLWPLVKRHNWTYADLLKVIRQKVDRPKSYPCDREQSFATYCTNVLGLRKTGKGRSSKGELPGAAVARGLLGLNK